MIIKKSDGFSLMELMIVVAIVGIASLIAIPQFLQWRKDFNLKGSARDLMGFMQKAKLSAVKEREPKRFKVSSTGFEITKTDTDETVLESWDWKDYVYLDSENTTLTAVTFSPSGLADLAGDIVLKSVESAGDASSDPRKYVKIRVTIAGSITIEAFTPPPSP